MDSDDIIVNMPEEYNDGGDDESVASEKILRIKKDNPEGALIDAMRYGYFAMRYYPYRFRATEDCKKNWKDLEYWLNSLGYVNTEEIILQQLQRYPRLTSGFDKEKSGKYYFSSWDENHEIIYGICRHLQQKPLESAIPLLIDIVREKSFMASPACVLIRYNKLESIDALIEWVSSRISSDLIDWNISMHFDGDSESTDWIVGTIAQLIIKFGQQGFVKLEDAFKIEKHRVAVIVIGMFVTAYEDGMKLLRKTSLLEIVESFFEGLIVDENKDFNNWKPSLQNPEEIREYILAEGEGVSIFPEFIARAREIIEQGL